MGPSIGSDLTAFPRGFANVINRLQVFGRKESFRLGAA
jgi:hypothetical protein